jgi:hypothetical protein
MMRATGSYNTAVGLNSLQESTGSHNTAIGNNAINANTSGEYNTAVGRQALVNSSTASGNVAVGYQAAYANTSAYNITVVGTQAGYSNQTGLNNTFIGTYAGYSSNFNGLALNTFVGYASGINVSTGTKNTILGPYNGNQGGLDIRTASNYVVLSDGDGNPRGVFDASGNFGVGTTSFYPSTPHPSGSQIRVGLTGNYFAQNSAGLGIPGTSFVDNAFVKNSIGDFAYITSAKASRINARNGEIVFSRSSGTDTADAAVNFITTAYMDSAGNTKFEGNISVGGATVTTSGTGITFPATQSASSNANTLDDYEEGTFTITVTAGGTFTSLSEGRYTKIGRQVFVMLNPGTTAITGQIQFSGLPFAVSGARSALVTATAPPTGVIYAPLFVDSSSIYINVTGTYAGGEVSTYFAAVYQTS